MCFSTSAPPFIPSTSLISPEYQNGGEISVKTDSYAVGIVLCELLTGLNPMSQPLSYLVEGALEDEKLASILDKNAVWDLDIAWQLADIAIRCSQGRKEKRSTAQDVLPELERLRNPNYMPTLAVGGTYYHPDTGLLTQHGDDSDSDDEGLSAGQPAALTQEGQQPGRDVEEGAANVEGGVDAGSSGLHEPLLLGDISAGERGERGERRVGGARADGERREGGGDDADWARKQEVEEDAAWGDTKRLRAHGRSPPWYLSKLSIGTMLLLFGIACVVGVVTHNHHHDTSPKPSPPAPTPSKPTVVHTWVALEEGVASCEHVCAFDLADGFVSAAEGFVSITIGSTQQVTIDGGGHAVIDAHSKDRMFLVQGSLVMMNAVMQNGHSSNNSDDGGAIFVNSSGNGTFENCSFLDNVAVDAGGALTIDGPVALKNCTFKGNKAKPSMGGGAIWSGPGGAVNIIDCNFIAGSETSIGFNDIGHCTPSKCGGSSGAVTFSCPEGTIGGPALIADVTQDEEDYLLVTQLPPLQQVVQCAFKPAVTACNGSSASLLHGDCNAWQWFTRNPLYTEWAEAKCGRTKVHRTRAAAHSHRWGARTAALRTFTFLPKACLRAAVCQWRCCT
jgi:hypothetical protein